jgi:hypothetical protein
LKSHIRITPFKSFQLGSQILYLFFRALEAFEDARPVLLRGFKEESFAAIRDKLAAIQMQFLDVKCTSVSESLKGAIRLFDDMYRYIISQRMKDARTSVGPPGIPLEFVAGVAAVHPVFRLVQTALGSRLKMVNGEFCSHGAFTDSAVTATKLEAAPQRLALILSHRLLVRGGPRTTG